MELKKKMVIMLNEHDLLECLKKIDPDIPDNGQFKVENDILTYSYYIEDEKNSTE